MKWKNILFTSLFLAACLIYLKVSKQRDEDTLDPKLVPFHKESIERIALSWSSENIVCFKRGQDEWWLETPVEARASEKEIDGLLRELEDVTVKDGIDLQRAKTNLADYGLDHPQLTLSLEGTEGRFSLSMGKKDPEESWIYIACEGAQLDRLQELDVFLVKAPLLSRLQKSAFELRDKRLVRFDKNRIEELSISNKADTFICNIGQDNQWHLTEPMKALGDKARIQSLINDIDKLRIRRFLKQSSDFSSYGPVQVQVGLREKDEALPTLFFLGAPHDQDPGFVYAWTEDNPWICLTDSAMLEALAITLYEMRNKTVTKFDSDKVELLEIERGKEQILLEKRDLLQSRDWWLKQPMEWKANTHAVENLLFEMESLIALDFVEDQPQDVSPYGLKQPRARVTVHLSPNAEKEPERTQTLLIGNTVVGKSDSSRRHLYAMREGSNTVVKIAFGIWDEVNRSSEDFRDKTILSFNAWDARAITVEHPDRTLELERLESGNWMILEPISSQAQSSKVTDLLYLIDELKAIEFIENNPSDLTPYGLDHPRVSLKLTLRDKDVPSGLSTHHLLLGGDQKEMDEKLGIFAMLPSSGWVCVVRPELLEDLDVYASDLTG